MVLSPLGVAEITPEETRFIRFDDRRKLAAVLAIGLRALTQSSVK